MSRSSGRNHELAVACRQSQDALGGLRLREDQPDLRPVTSRLAVGRIVHLEDEVRTSRNQLSLPLAQSLGRSAGSEPGDELPVGPTVATLGRDEAFAHGILA